MALVGGSAHCNIVTRCVHFYEGRDCIRNAYTIELDSSSLLDEYRRPFGKAVLHRDVSVGELEYTHSGRENRFYAVNTLL